MVAIVGGGQNVKFAPQPDMTISDLVTLLRIVGVFDVPLDKNRADALRRHPELWRHFAEHREAA